MLISDNNVGARKNLADDPQGPLGLHYVASTNGSPMIPEIESTDYTLPLESKKSFESVLFRRKLVEFDNKYGIRGRFGYEIDAEHASPTLGEHQEYQERMIPRVGLAHDEDTESNETSEASSDPSIVTPVLKTTKN